MKYKLIPIEPTEEILNALEYVSCKYFFLPPEGGLRDAYKTIVDIVPDIIDPEIERLKARVAELEAMNATCLRPEVLAFAIEMEKRLRENDHKNHWSQCNIDYLIDRFLRCANVINEPIGSRETQHHAVDTANYAMMIADTCKAKP